MSGGYHTGPCRYRPFLSLQEFLLGNAGLEAVTLTGKSPDPVSEQGLEVLHTSPRLCMDSESVGPQGPGDFERETA